MGKKIKSLSFSLMIIFLSCQNNLLTEAFGSDKRKRALASRLKNKVDKVGEKVADVVDAISSETLDETGLKNSFSVRINYVLMFGLIFLQKYHKCSN